MKQDWGRKERCGTVLLCVALLASFAVQRMNDGLAFQAAIIAQCAGVFAALALMGVMRPERGPLNYLIPGGLAALYFVLVAVQTVTTPRSELLQKYSPSYLSMLMMVSALGLGVWSAVQRRSWAEFDARQAAGLLAAMLLTGLSWLIKSSMAGLAHPRSGDKVYQALLIAPELFSILILPLLHKSRRGGVVMMIVGAVCFALSLVGERMVRLQVTEPPLYMLRMLVLFSPLEKVYIALMAGGLWCALPACQGVDKTADRA